MSVFQKSKEINESSIARLIRSESFYPMSQESALCLVDMGELFEIKTGECVVEAGRIAPDWYFLIEGVMRSWIWEGADNIDRTVAFAIPGTLVVSLHSFLFSEKATTNYEACSPCTLLRVPAENIRTLINSSPEFARWALGNAQTQLYFYDRKRSEIHGTARERYNALMGHRPDLIRRIPLKFIASYLHVTPQYLSKLRKNFTAIG